MVMATPGQARRRRDMLQIDPPYLLTPSTAGGREEKGLRNRIKRSSAFMASLLLSRESRSLTGLAPVSAPVLRAGPAAVARPGDASPVALQRPDSVYCAGPSTFKLLPQSTAFWRLK
jgi:hypothetical protein